MNHKSGVTVSAAQRPQLRSLKAKSTILVSEINISSNGWSRHQPQTDSSQETKLHISTQIFHGQMSHDTPWNLVGLELIGQDKEKIWGGVHFNVADSCAFTLNIASCFLSFQDVLLLIKGALSIESCGVLNMERVTLYHLTTTTKVLCRLSLHAT